MMANRCGSAYNGSLREPARDGAVQIIYGEEDVLLPWAAERIGVSFRDDARTIGLARNDGTLVAVVVYDSFSRADCNMHIASDGSGHWMTKQLVLHAFAYPFVQCGLRRVTGLVPAKNTRALEFDLKLGFEVEGLCRNALPDDDIIVLGMTRDRCRFIAQEHRHA
jgi:RimJ/RimL family protein N-acetyltransferase